MRTKKRSRRVGNAYEVDVGEGRPKANGLLEELSNPNLKGSSR
jgi:hypothetical protein